MSQGKKTEFRAAAAAGFAAVVLFSAGVVAPLANGGDAEARERASAEALDVAAAFRDFLIDCERELRSSGGPTPLRFYGPGVLPREDAASAARSSFPISGVLERDAFGLGAAWRGPYAERTPIDPWGRAWIVRMDDDGPRSLRVLSAGPDGVVDTLPGSPIDPRDVGVEVVR
jgi:hypothetical protein